MALTDLTKSGKSGRQSSKLLFAILGLAILLIPYDAIRYLPSDYRPLALIPLAAMVLFCIKDFLRIRLGASVGVLTLFSGFAVVVTYVDYRLFGTSGDYFDCLVTIWLGLFVFFVVYCGFKTKAQYTEMHTYILWFADLVSLAYLVPMIVGLLQAAATFGIVPDSVVSTIGSFFGTKRISRIPLTSSESSWASVQMLFALPLFYISYINSNKKLPLFELWVFSFLFLLNVSAQGYLTLAIAFILFPFLLSAVRGDMLDLVKKAIPIVMLVLALIVGIYYAVQVFPVPDYVRTRVVNFVSIDNLIHKDSSSFIRICYPLLSLAMWANSPFLGFGGGSYGGLFAEYIAKMFPWALDGRFPEVNSNFIGTSTPSACNLYTRTLGDFGLVGFLLYGAFILFCLGGLRAFKTLPKHEFYALLLWASILISIPIQFQSYCYVPVLMGLAFISASGIYISPAGADGAKGNLK